MGDLKAMQGKYDEAAAIFAKFDPLNDAKEEYRRIQSFPLIRLQHGDVYAASFYWLGKIAEKEGKRAEAVDKYSKFLDLWENADPGLSEVVDARRRLAALK
jgi:cytochrome c-type biogenesis protein CcmH/NrfG